MSEYSKEVLCSIYELGRLYFEMGYFAPAERIFGGLAAIDEGWTPSLVGLGLVKLECGLYKESSVYFREALDKSQFSRQAKMGLAAAFIAVSDFKRARSILEQLERDLIRNPEIDPETRKLLEALVLRCR